MSARLVVGAAVLAAFLLDRFALLPGYEAGRGGTGEAWTVWLLVNLTPAGLAAWFARVRGAGPGRAFKIALAVIALTGLAAFVALLWYVGAESKLS